MTGLAVYHTILKRPAQASLQAPPSLWAGAIVILSMIIPLAALMYIVIGVFLPPLTAIFLALCAWLLTPLLTAQGDRRWLAPVLAVAAGGGLAAWLIVTVDFNERFPRSVDLAFIFDADQDQGYWATQFQKSDPWTAPLISNAPAPIDVSIKPYGQPLALYGAAAAYKLETGPVVDAEWVNAEGTSNGEVRISISIMPRRPGDRLIVAPIALPAHNELKLMGRSIGHPMGIKDIVFDYRATSQTDPVEIEFTFDANEAPDSVSLRVISIAQDIDTKLAGAIPPQPDDAMPIANRFGSWVTAWTGTIELSRKDAFRAVPAENQ